MQSIERYGVVALLFLVVTVIAVLVWDGDAPLPGADRVAQAAAKSSTPDVTPATTTAPRRVKLESPPTRAREKPLSRELAAERKREEEARRKAADAAAEADFGVRELDGSTPAAAGIVPGDGSKLATAPPKSERRRNKRRTIGAEDPKEPVADPVPLARKQAEPTRSTTGRTYTIESGDTLSEIAMNKLGTMSRWGEIVELNPGLDPAKLIVGKTIRLPLTKAGEGVAASAPKGTKREARADVGRTAGTNYEVESGDSLWRIAAARLGDGERWTEIAELNPSIDANRLRPGQKLVLPSGATPRSEPSTAVPPVVASTGGSDAKRGRVR